MFIFRYSKFLHNHSEDEWSDEYIVKDIDNREVNIFFFTISKKKNGESRKPKQALLVRKNEIIISFILQVMK